ncbi:RecX family transcriptional regulator [Oenococcus alcoholitolerans]|uniref:RecX family transcriptional regulator n=1 Tax=Oenococcus alcoholitolerans TaxID=931074 RepID=UPI003F6E7593
MKKVTKISVQKRKGRYNLELDGKFAFGVSEMTLIKFGLQKGQELSQQRLQQLKKYEKFASALSKAINYLSHHLRTEKEIRDKLSSQDFENETIFKAIERLKKENYLNDLFYAQSYVSTQSKLAEQGPIKIAGKLKLLGIKEDTIKQALVEYGRDEQIQRAAEIIDKLKKHLLREPVAVQKRKIKQRLYAKGFSFDLIDELLDKTEFIDDQQAQIHSAEKLLDRIWDNYARYGRQRSYKARSYLYSKGFSIDIIDKLIGQKTNE